MSVTTHYSPVGEKRKAIEIAHNAPLGVAVELATFNFFCHLLLPTFFNALHHQLIGWTVVAFQWIPCLTAHLTDNRPFPGGQVAVMVI